MTATKRPAPKAAPPRSAPSIARPPIPDSRVSDRDADSKEHRKFPRLEIRTQFRCTIPDEEGETAFSATFTSSNLSVSGVFLESTFFLPIGQELHAEFELPGDETTVKGRAVIVREERDDVGKERSGFALRFLEFFDQSEVALAKVFLGARLRSFAADYLKSRRAKELDSELDRVTDALAAWELLKITAERDVWEG